VGKTFFKKNPREFPIYDPLHDEDDSQDTVDEASYHKKQLKGLDSFVKKVAALKENIPKTSDSNFLAEVLSTLSVMINELNLNLNEVSQSFRQQLEEQRLTLERNIGGPLIISLRWILMVMVAILLLVIFKY